MFNPEDFNVCLNYMSNKVTACSRLMVIGCLLITAACGKNTETKPADAEIETSTYRFQLRNTSGRQLDKAKFTLHLPVPKTHRQTLLDYNLKGASLPKHREYVDMYGNKILEIKFEGVPANFEAPVLLTTRVALARKPVSEPSAESDATAKALDVLKGALSGSASSPAEDGEQPLLSDSGTNPDAGTDADTDADSETGGEVVQEERPSNCVVRSQELAQAALAKGLDVQAIFGLAGEAGNKEFMCWIELNVDGDKIVFDPEQQEVITLPATAIALRILDPNASEPGGALSKTLYSGYGLDVSPILVE